MKLDTKLQELRIQKGLTQEEVASSLFVTRAAISKWESGRGYPGIDSLKEIAKFYGVTVDYLLSSEEIITLATEEQKEKKSRFCDLVFALLDLSFSLLFFLPFFGEKVGEEVREVSLIFMTTASPYLKICYVILLICAILLGIFTLAMQNHQGKFWTRFKTKFSLFLNALCCLIFIISLQPYAAVFLFALLLIKAFLVMKR